MWHSVTSDGWAVTLGRVGLSFLHFPPFLVSYIRIVPLRTLNKVSSDWIYHSWSVNAIASHRNVRSCFTLILRRRKKIKIKKIKIVDWTPMGLPVMPWDFRECMHISLQQTELQWNIYRWRGWLKIHHLLITYLHYFNQTTTELSTFQEEMAVWMLISQIHPGGLPRTFEFRSFEVLVIFSSWVRQRVRYRSQFSFAAILGFGVLACDIGLVFGCVLCVLQRLEIDLLMQRRNHRNFVCSADVAHYIRERSLRLLYKNWLRG